MAAVHRLPPGPIVVTGATGFLGTHLVRLLGESGRGADVVAVSRHGSPSVDLRNAAEVDALVAETRPVVIFHLAGLIFSSDLDELYQSNVAPTGYLLSAVLRHAPECRVIVPGSAAEYGRVASEDLPIGEGRLPAPVVPYGLSKAWQTASADYYATRGARVVIARLFNVVGTGAPAGLSVGAFVEQLRAIMSGKAPPRLLVGNLATRRDFLDADDAGAAMLALASRADASGVYNVCSGSSVSMTEVLDILVRHSGVSIEVALDDSRLRPADIPDSYGTSERLRAATGWRPRVTLDESLARMLLPAPPPR